MSDSITTKDGTTFTINSEHVRGEGRFYWIERRDPKAERSVRDEIYDGTYSRATANGRLRRTLQAWALMKALHSLSSKIAGAHGITVEGDWCYADTLARHAAHNYGVEVTPIAAGRILSELARRDMVLVRRGPFNTYKHPENV